MKTSHTVLSSYLQISAKCLCQEYFGVSVIGQEFFPPELQAFMHHCVARGKHTGLEVDIPSLVKPPSFITPVLGFHPRDFDVIGVEGPQHLGL